jgi:uncharacterized membrane protein
MQERTKTRYIFAVFFILCGLIIGILGVYGCVAVRHYNGAISLTDSSVPILETMYPNNITKGDSALSYDIVSTKKIDNLSYTTSSNLSVLFVVIGLGYLGLGIGIILKEGLLFDKNKVAR